MFADETARSQLVEHGEVITFRTSERTVGKTWWRESRTGKKRGDVVVEKLRTVNPRNTDTLAEHLDLSGFGSVSEWQSAIRRLNGGGLPDEGVLYRARSLDAELAAVETGDDRPTALEFRADAVPDKLTALDQWVAWRYEWNDDRSEWTKVPIDVRTEAFAKSTDPETWTSFADAAAFHERTGTDTDGVGFVVSDDDLLVGIDLDDCRDPETGNLEPWADDLLDDVPTYAEVSPSGTGLRLFGFGFVPDGGNRADVDDGDGHLEMYETDRYLTVTGHHVDETPADVRQVNDEIADVHAEYIADDGRDDRTAGDNVATPDGDGRTVEPTDVGDAELLSKAKDAANGEKFARLWRGDTSGYPSHSEADLALCGLLAFWTGGDRARIDRLFRDSGLYREKWDRDDYRENTISKAVDGRTDYYDAPDSSRASADGGAEAATDDDADAWKYIRDLYASSDGGTTGDATYQAVQQLCAEDEYVTTEDTDELWRYDPADGIYRPDGMIHVRRRLNDVLGSAYSRRRVGEALHRLRSATYTPRDAVGGPDEMICLANGVLDVSDPSSPALTDHSPEYRFVASHPVDYDPDASVDGTEFIDFVNDSVRDEDREKLQEYAGYALHHWGQPHKKACMLVGPTNSGKGTFLRILTALLGAENVASESLYSLCMTRWGTAELYGRVANIRNELSPGGLKNAVAFKELTGGGDMISAEKKGQDPFRFVPTAKHLFATNQVPDVEHDDDAFHERWLFVSFPNTVPVHEQDDGLDDRIIDDELPAVLNWALDGYARLRENGRFTNERGLDDKTDMWEQYGDSVDRFKSNALTVTGDPDDVVQKSDVYDVYTAFCSWAGVSADPQATVTRRLKEDPEIDDARPRLDGKKTNCYTGVTLDERALRELDEIVVPFNDSNDGTDDSLDNY